MGDILAGNVKVASMDDEAPPGECVFCDRVWGIVGVATALIIGAVGLDLLLGGALTRVFFRPVTWQEAVS